MATPQGPRSGYEKKKRSAMGCIPVLPGSFHAIHVHLIHAISTLSSPAALLPCCPLAQGSLPLTLPFWPAACVSTVIRTHTTISSEPRSALLRASNPLARLQNPQLHPPPSLSFDSVSSHLPRPSRCHLKVRGSSFLFHLHCLLIPPRTFTTASTPNGWE